jgi:hypothetical protein
MMENSSKRSEALQKVQNLCKLQTHEHKAYLSHEEKGNGSRKFARIRNNDWIFPPLFCQAQGRIEENSWEMTSKYNFP